jgi:hypothetical protein
MQNQPLKISLLGKRSIEALREDLSLRQRTSKSIQEEESSLKDDQNVETI